MPIVHYDPKEEDMPPLVTEFSGQQIVLQPPDKYWTKRTVRTIVGIRSDKLGRPITDRDAPEHARFMFGRVEAWAPSTAPALVGAKPSHAGHSQTYLLDTALKHIRTKPERSTTLVLGDRDTRSEADDVYRVEKVQGLHAHLVNEDDHRTRHRKTLEALQAELAQAREEAERQHQTNLDAVHMAKSEELDRVRAEAREAAESRRHEFEMEEVERQRALAAEKVKEEIARAERKAARRKKREDAAPAPATPAD